MSNCNAVKLTTAQQGPSAAPVQDRHLWDNGTGSSHGAQRKHKSMLHWCNTTNKCHEIREAEGQPTKKEIANGKDAISTTGAELTCNDLTSQLGSSPSLKKCAHLCKKGTKLQGKYRSSDLLNY